MNANHISTPAEWGQLIRARRKQAGLSIDELASMLGLSPRFLSEVERGKPGASIGRVLQICAALGLLITITPK
ncbi:MAG: helix-turn-helix domain-containing protein [Akkermansia muciniphila]|nr:helix-turn-helix domain-containing protein [Akkermansia muciniphila]